MMIGKVGYINPLNTELNVRRVNDREVVNSSPDTINISNEGREAYEINFMKRVADETPDIREDLVASIKEKIKDPNYLSPERIGLTAQKVMEAYGL